MPRYTWYILRQLIGPFLLVTFGLVAVIWLTQSLRLVDLIVNKGLSLSTLIELSLLLLPTFLSPILPIALFCAILFAYNKLTMDSELVSLRSAGIGPLSLATPAILLAAVVVVASYAITLYFVPVSYRSFKERQFVIRTDYSSVLLQEGVFTSLVDDVTVYVRERNSEGELLGILVHDARLAEQPVTMMAESGALVDTDAGPRFVLINGNRQEMDRDNGRLSLLYFDSYALDLGMLAKKSQSRWREARERFLHELFNPGDDPDDQRNRKKFLAEGHQRIVSPLYGFAVTAIALAALLSGQMNRRGQWRRILLGIIAAVVFEAVGLALVNAAAKTSALIPLMYLNVAAALAGSIYILGRKQSRPRGRATPIPQP